MRRNWLPAIVAAGVVFMPLSCAPGTRQPASSPASDDKVGLVVLDPGHYHAALVQKTMYDQVDSTVHVYAPDGPEVREYLARIEGFNARSEDPTNWREQVYTGRDYLEQMKAESAGDVVVISGNNRKKAQYIMAAIEANMNVLADKPMCIDAAGFEVLQRAFVVARQRGLLLYDIMTERYNTLCILQKLLVQDGDVFGELEQGSPAEPAVVKESVHHFFKYVAGKPIRRPTWYFDTAQQGEGLVDVTTHLIDLVMWTCFPEQPIRWAGEVTVERARHWPTMIARQQYAKVTGATDFPDFLRGKLNEDGVLPYYCNGEMLFAIKGVHVGITVKWDFEAPQDGGDTHHSLFRGSRARVIIRQGKEQDYRPQLHVEPAPGTDPQRLRIALDRFIARLQTQYPGLALAPRSRGWQVLVPQEHLIGHEAHFRQVTEKYLQYLSQGGLPEWEIAYMKTKYHITTTALKLARH